MVARCGYATAMPYCQTRSALRPVTSRFLTRHGTAVSSSHYSLHYIVTHRTLTISFVTRGCDVLPFVGPDFRRLSYSRIHTKAIYDVLTAVSRQQRHYVSPGCEDKCLYVDGETTALLSTSKRVRSALNQRECT